MIFGYTNFQDACAYDVTAGEYFGEVLLMKDVVTFEESTPNVAEHVFCESADINLDRCKQESSSSSKLVRQGMQSTRAAF